MRRFFGHRSAFIALSVLWLLFFWRYFIPGPERVMFPDGDFTQQFFIFRDIAYRALAAGHLPLWADCFFVGYPFHADPQSQLFYPPIWISFAILKMMGWGSFPLFALTLEATVHYLLAGVFTYLFLRAELSNLQSPNLQSPAALLGAIVFTYGGYLTGYPPLQTAILETVTWLPLILLAFRRLADPTQTLDSKSRAVWPALTLAIAFFAGHPQTFLFVFYFSLAYFLHRAAVNRRPWRWTLTRLAAVFALFFGLSLVQLLPQAQYLSLSTRSSLSFDELSAGFPLGIVRQFFIRDPLWNPLYVGLLPLALAALALPPFSRWALSPQGEGPGVKAWNGAWFWFAVAGVALLLSFGGNTPAYTIAYWLLPGYRLFRRQERLAMLVSFALATLAAFGAATLFNTLARRTQNRLQLGAAFLCLVAFTVFDLLVARTSSNLAPPFDPYPYLPILDPIRADSDPFFRVQADAPTMQGHFACGYGFKEWGGISPIRPAAWAAFDEHAPESLRWKVIGMKYLITWKNGALTRENELPPAERVAQGLAPQGEAKVYRMFEIPRRAWLVYQTETAADTASIFAALQTPGFDPFTTAVVRASTPPLVMDAVSVGGGGVGSVSITDDYPGHLALTVAADTPALLVISEAYYPGWVATVNGQSAPVLEADAFLLAVPIPAGESKVELDYRPSLLAIGVLLSMITLLVCAGLVSIRRFNVLGTGQ